MSSIVTKGLISSLKKGKQILQNVLKSKTQKVAVKVAEPHANLQKCNAAVQPVQFRTYLYNNLRLFIPRVYFNSFAARLGRQAAWRAGRNAPLLAFVGLVSLKDCDTTDNEITTKIQDFLTASVPEERNFWQGIQQLSFSNFEFGNNIGQGCNAAVYEARWKNSDEENADSIASNLDLTSNDNNIEQSEVTADNQTQPNNTHSDDMVNQDLGSDANEVEADKQSVNGSYDDEDGCYGIESSAVDDSDTESDITILSWESDEEFLREEGAPTMFTVDDEDEFIEAQMSDISMDASDEEFDIVDDTVDTTEHNNSPVAMLQAYKTISDNGRVEEYAIDSPVTHVLSMYLSTDNLIFSLTSLPDPDHELNQEEGTEGYQSMDNSVLLDDGRTRPKLTYDLAVKMMFNYDIESNATAILRSMEKETVPAQFLSMQGQMDILKSRKKSLPPHPNIVDMLGVFVDPMPSFPDGLLNYPAALPSRISSDGLGRNMTMFIIMKRYDMTLTEYLSVVNPTFRERIYLLAQLLEAVDHLGKHCISHRDMKTDNILLDLNGDFPQLVLSDFGCCLADPQHGLILPYPSDEIGKGGNTALMAPEIASAEPGTYVKLDYRKADLWGVGAIAYEILGADNPFYTTGKGKLDTRNYKDSELPPLPCEVPEMIKRAVLSLLSRNPKERPSPRYVLNLLYTFLWAPEEWLDEKINVKVTRSEVSWWIVVKATDLLLRQRHDKTANCVETMLLNLFLQNVQLRHVYSVLEKFGSSVI